MMLLRQGETTGARRRVPVRLVDDTDGKTPILDVTVVVGDLKISRNGGTEQNHGGTWAQIGGGDYYYEYTFDELDTFGFIRLRVIKSGVRTFDSVSQVVAFNVYSVSSDPWAVSLPGDPSYATGTAGFILGNVAQLPDIEGQIWNAPRSSHVASGSFGEGVPVAAVNAGAIAAASLANDAITAAKIAPGAIDAATFAADSKSYILRNQDLVNFPFVMLDFTTRAPRTGLTVSGFRLKSNGVPPTFAPLDTTGGAGVVTEIGNGWYLLNKLTAADNDAPFVALRFTATNAVDNNQTLITHPAV